MRCFAVFFLICLAGTHVVGADNGVADANSTDADAQTGGINVWVQDKLEVAIENESLPVTIENSNLLSEPLEVEMSGRSDKPVKVTVEPAVLNVRLNTNENDEELKVEVDSDAPWWSVIATVAAAVAAAVAAIAAWRAALQNRRAAQVQGFHSLIKDYASPKMGDCLHKLHEWLPNDLGELVTKAQKWAVSHRATGNSHKELDNARRKVKYYFDGIAILLRGKYDNRFSNWLLGGTFLDKTFVTEMWGLDNLEELNRVLIALEAALLKQRDKLPEDRCKVEELSSIERILQKCWPEDRQADRWTNKKLRNEFCLDTSVGQKAAEGKNSD